MSEASRILGDIAVDAKNLYREEIFTDLKVATVRRLVPVTPSGADDPTREPLFLAQTQIMSQAGPVPVQATLQAKTLEGALADFPRAVQEAVERLIEEVRELQRQEASRIVVPTGPVPGVGGPGGSRIIS